MTFLQNLSKCVLIPFLTKLFIISIKEEIFPENFKIAYAFLIAKVSTPKTCGDLHPIFILSASSKIFEKNLENKISKFIDKNHIIIFSQIGFQFN